MKPLLAPQQQKILARFARGRVLLAFDFDGTLAPLVAKASDAAMRPRTARLFNAVAHRYPCVIVTGRRARDIRRRLGNAPVAAVVGNHGADSAEDRADVRRIVAAAPLRPSWRERPAAGSKTRRTRSPCTSVRVRRPKRISRSCGARSRRFRKRASFPARTSSTSSPPTRPTRAARSCNCCDRCAATACCSWATMRPTSGCSGACRRRSSSACGSAGRRIRAPATCSTARAISTRCSRSSWRCETMSRRLR